MGHFELYDVEDDHFEGNIVPNLVRDSLIVDLKDDNGNRITMRLDRGQALDLADEIVEAAGGLKK